MSDIRIYDYNGASNLVPLTGDVILCTDEFNGAQANSVHLCTNATGPVWKSFANDAAVEAFVNQYSLSFNGTSDFVNTTPFDLTTNKTVSYWINLTSISSAGIYIFGQGASYYSYLTSNGQTMYIYNGSSASPLNIGATHAVTTGVWTHIAITGDGSTARLYKNGVERAAASDKTPAGISRFGGDNVGGSRFVHGFMDEVAVWDAQLSASDISSIYNNGPSDLLDPSSYDTDRTSNLVHWWRMGDASNGIAVDGGIVSSITDSSGNGNTATQATASSQPTFSTSVPA